MKEVKDMTLAELQIRCQELGLRYLEGDQRKVLQQKINDHLESEATKAASATSASAPAPASDAETPVEPEMVQISKDDFRLLMESLKENRSRLLELEAKMGSPEQVKLTSEGDLFSQGHFIKELIAEIRGETNKAGHLRAKYVPKEDTLEEEARFWVRAPFFKMNELMIGAIPQELPYGMKEIKFTTMVGPVAMKDPSYPIPQVIMIVQFRTKIKGLAEMIRQDARYGSRIFEDTTQLLGQPKGHEYHVALERHLTTLRSNPDPSYVNDIARQEGIPFTAGTNPEKLRYAIAHQRAEQEINGQLASLNAAAEERRKEASLRRESLASPTSRVGETVAP